MRSILDKLDLLKITQKRLEKQKCAYSKMVEKEVNDLVLPHFLKWRTKVARPFNFAIAEITKGMGLDWLVDWIIDDVYYYRRADGLCFSQIEEAEEPTIEVLLIKEL